MPIIIDRETGEVIAPQELTQGQKDALWEAYVRAYIRRHPEIFNRGEQADAHVMNSKGTGARSEGVPVKTEKKTYSVAEAAKVVGISVSNMYALVKTTGFPSIRVGRRWLVSVKGLEQWLEKRVEKY